MFTARTIVFTIALSLVPGAALGQGVRWESTGTVEFGGALGLIASLAGDNATRTTYALQDGRWLIDSESAGTISDYAAGTVTMIDHDDRTYFTSSPADMARAIEAKSAEARERIDDARAEAGEESYSAEPTELNLNVNVSVDRPGDRQQIAGYDSERFIVTVEIGGEAVSADEGVLPAGTLVLLSDVWTSRDFPAERARREMLEAHPEWMNVEELREAGTGILEAFALDGRIKVAMQASDAEVEETGGHALLSRTSLVLVPPGAVLDRAAVFSGYDQPLSPDVKGAAAGAAKDAAKDAAAGAVSGMLGRFGLGKKQEEEPKEADPTQMIVMRVTDRVTTVDEGDLPPQTFLPPAGYQERLPDWLQKD